MDGGLGTLKYYTISSHKTSGPLAPLLSGYDIEMEGRESLAVNSSDSDKTDPPGSEPRLSIRTNPRETPFG